MQFARSNWDWAKEKWQQNLQSKTSHSGNCAVLRSVLSAIANGSASSHQDLLQTLTQELVTKSTRVEFAW